MSAHSLASHHLAERAAAVVTAVLMLAALVVFWWGSCRRAPGSLRGALFHLAWLVSVLTVFGPLDDWAEHSTAWHMAQHMLLMMVIPPLFVMAAPLAQWQAALGARSNGLWRVVLKAGQYPVGAAVVHGILIWLWHAPIPYMLAVRNPWWHSFEHACFLFSAWLFWWAVLRVAWRHTVQAMFALLLSLMHTGLLAALFVFAADPFYDEARSLADQQLAGLIMWVPGGGAYLLVALWCGHRWFRRWRAYDGQKHNSLKGLKASASAPDAAIRP